MSWKAPGTAARPRLLLCSGIVGMAVPCAARRFKSDSSKRPRELNLRCIESRRAMHRPREADSSRNGRNDDAAPAPARRVPAR
ncbi:hypothetical protein DF153_17730 [Burkholderia cenocepacia]|nr:hypothetical protein DF152_19195 [Burkholderia cenocepacia]RQU23330.1 hypothetical protein DF153_17730 [Burkholderia cenocepacia]